MNRTEPIIYNIPVCPSKLTWHLLFSAQQIYSLPDETEVSSVKVVPKIYLQIRQLIEIQWPELTWLARDDQSRLPQTQSMKSLKPISDKWILPTPLLEGWSWILKLSSFSSQITSFLRLNHISLNGCHCRKSWNNLYKSISFKKFMLF